MTRDETLESAFIELFGYAPGLKVRAPGRVDLMGSHTDYNQGSVLALAIDPDIRIYADRREDGFARIRSMNLNEDIQLDLATLPQGHQTSGWGRYIEGVARVLQAAGFELSGCDALIHGTVPAGSGLSSSAALEVATALLFLTLAGAEVEPVALAKYCQCAEQSVVGVPCGVLDQYLSAMGVADSALLLDCRTLTHQAVSFPEALSVMVCDTRAPRQLSSCAYKERREQCEEGVRLLAESDPDVTALRDVSCDALQAAGDRLPELIQKRCRYVIEEQARVYDMAAALQTLDKNAIQTLMNASFYGARDLYGICVPEMEAMYESMITAPGVVGARQAGAGFGGSMVALVWKSDVRGFAESVTADYSRRTGQNAQVYEVFASDGAGVLKKGDG